MNIFGAGFIGSKYVEKYGGVVNNRNDYFPKESEILYFISTTDNYNLINNNSLIDIETNLVLLMKILDNCRINYGNNFVFNFISSWFVYGDSKEIVCENSVCSPKGFYSITKKTAEDLLISYCEAFSIKYRILRLCNVLGNDTKVSKNKNILQFLYNKIKNNEDVLLYNKGNFYRDFLFVEDVVDAIQLIVTKGNTNDIYNVGSGTMVKFDDIIKYIKTTLNSSSNIFYNDEYCSSVMMDVTKLKNLGFTPKKTVYNILEL